MKLSDCPHCKGPLVTAKATDFGDEYLYCRTCKKEIEDSSNKDDLIKTFDEFINKIPVSPFDNTLASTEDDPFKYVL